MANKKIQLKLTQIVAGAQLYGLDQEGRVWKYTPATATPVREGGQAAFWTRLTAYASMWVRDGEEGDE